MLAYILSNKSQRILKSINGMVLVIFINIDIWPSYGPKWPKRPYLGIHILSNLATIFGGPLSINKKSQV